MEDLKQIQEFFSKPVKENSRKSPDFILTEPAEIKYTESFGTGIKAPGVLHHANEGVFLGAEGAYIIVLPGGTFYVDEDKEEAMPIWPLKDQDQALHFALDYTPFSPKFETWKSWIKRPNVKEATKDEETEFHTKLDKLVHDTFGKRKGEMEEYNTGIYYTPDTKEKTKDAAKSGMERVKDMLKKIMKEEEGYSKFLKDDPEHPGGKTKGLTPDVLNKILMNVIKDLDESRPGLWDNIRAKKEKGEKMSHPNSKAYKSAVKAGKKINKAKN